MEKQVLEWGHSGPAYVLAKFRRAVHAFHEHNGPLEERIYQTYFYFQLIPESDLPSRLRDAYRKISKAFVRYPDPHSRAKASRIGDALYTMRKMSEDDCMLIINRLAALIVEIENLEDQRFSVRRYRPSPVDLRSA